jgi:hypothetical protein
MIVTVLAPAAYPAHREADVVLRDGAVVHVRPVRPDDEPALVELFRSLSLNSRLFRFFSLRPPTTPVPTGAPRSLGRSPTIGSDAPE